MNEHYEESWPCPICGINTNSKGEPFSGSRSVACHIAGKILYGHDTKHKSWALNKVGDSINEPSVKRTVNTLAEVLEWHVEEDHKALKPREQTEPAAQASQYLKKIETELHQFVRRTLQKSLGEDESEWWAKGIPLQIRIDCATRRQQHSCEGVEYDYTYLIDLKKIISDNWGIFAPYFQSVQLQKKEAFDKMDRVNYLRNKDVHPIRTPISEEELAFLSWFYDVVRNVINSE